MKRELGLGSYFRPYRLRIAVLGGISLIAAQAEAAALVLVIPLVQAITDQEPVESLGPLSMELDAGPLLGLTFVAIAIAVLANVVVALVRARTVAEFEHSQRGATMHAFVSADFPTQLSVRAGRLQQLMNFVSRGGAVLANLVVGIRGGVSMLSFVVVAMLIEWQAAVAIVISGVVLFGLLRPLALRVKRLNRRQARLMVLYSQEIAEIGGQVRDLRLFGALPIIERRTDESSLSIARNKAQALFSAGLMQPAYQYAGLVFVLVAVVVVASATTVAIASLGAIALLLLRSLSYGQQLQTAYQSIQESLPYLEQLDEANREFEAAEVPRTGDPLPDLRSVELQRVSFTYPGGTQALEDVDLALAMGEVVGVVGPSGSGKSTLSQLLLRLREPSDGTIRVNGRPAAEYSLDSWYEHMSLVPQDVHIFHATVAENISLFRPEVTRDQIVEAARQAGIHTLIESLPEGYDTPVGPSFRDLSGGQSQRIGIARALCRGAQLLVLDEPTSALDAHSERIIQDTLESLRGKVMLVVIAHRLSTLSVCDRIAVLREGRVEAVGSPDQVLEASSYFRSALDAGRIDLYSPS